MGNSVYSVDVTPSTKGIPEYIDGKPYPVTWYSSFDELPSEIKSSTLSAVKDEIREWFTEYGASATMMTFVTPRVRRAALVGDHLHLPRRLFSSALLAEITTHCNSVFGPHVPYVITPTYDILFIKNV